MKNNSIHDLKSENGKLKMFKDRFEVKYVYSKQVS